MYYVLCIMYYVFYQQNLLKSTRGPVRILTGNQRRAEGLHICLEKNPTPTLPHTPIARLVEIINRLICAETSACAPTFATPISNEAPGIGRFTENEEVHVLPTLVPIPRTDAHALYPKLAGDAHGRTHADAPIDI